jgi:hypothetical protein
MKIQALLRLKILAFQASSKEPVGPALGQLGIPIMDFCTKFNGSTQKYINDTPLNVIIYSYGSQKYDFLIKFPDFSFFIKKCLIPFGFLNIKKPGYIIYPMDKFFYLTPYIIYEVISYCNLNNNELVVFFNKYKRLFNALKSNGFIVFSN